jgi:hypothetical protein
MSDTPQKFKVTIHFMDGSIPITHDFSEEGQAHEFAFTSMKDGAVVKLRGRGTMYIPPYNIRHIIVEESL